MSSFTDPLIVQKISKRRWKVYKGFRYYVGELGSDDFIDVPNGFETDFASVPRFFWRILPPDGQYTQAAVLHDYLYSTQKRERKEADNIFLEAMSVLDVAKWKRNIMFSAVRWFGGLVWKRKKE